MVLAFPADMWVTPRVGLQKRAQGATWFGAAEFPPVGPGFVVPSLSLVPTRPAASGKPTVSGAGELCALLAPVFVSLIQETQPAPTMENRVGTVGAVRCCGESGQALP